MLKTVEGIYYQGEIKLKEKPKNISPNTKVIVTFLTNHQSSNNDSKGKVLSNEEIEEILVGYRQENKPRPIGLCKGEFIISDDFNDPLPDEILTLFEG